MSNFKVCTQDTYDKSDKDTNSFYITEVGTKNENVYLGNIKLNSQVDIDNLFKKLEDLEERVGEIEMNWGKSDFDYLWDYINSVTLYNWEVEVITTDTSYDNYRFTIKFPFKADIEPLKFSDIRFVYDYGSGRQSIGTSSSNNVGLTIDFDETTSTLTVDCNIYEYSLEASGDPDYMGFLFNEITFNRSE